MPIEIYKGVPLYLVAAEFANYQNMGPFGTKNTCWAKEKSNGGLCVFFSEGIENPRCQYFEQAILSLDKGLKTIFSSEVLALQIRDNRARLIRRQCARCPETFLAKSNAQTLCPACQKRNAALKNRERQARFQKNQKNGLRLTESTSPTP